MLPPTIPGVTPAELTPGTVMVLGPAGMEVVPIQSLDAATAAAAVVPDTLNPIGPVAVGVDSPEAAPLAVNLQSPSAAPANPQQQRFQQPRRDRDRDRDREHIPLPPVKKVVLMNATDPGEIRVAILENGELAEIFMERKSRGQQAGNIYKGRVVNVEPSLQAAFVDLGTERNGFLHASDCIPPDGGYGDILTKFKPGAGRPQQGQPQQGQQPQQPRRDGRDGRNDRNDRNQQRRDQQQQHRRDAQPVSAPQTPMTQGTPVTPPAPTADAAAAPAASTPAPDFDPTVIRIARPSAINPSAPVESTPAVAAPEAQTSAPQSAPHTPHTPHTLDAQDDEGDDEGDDLEDGEGDDEGGDASVSDAPMIAGDGAPGAGVATGQPQQSGQRPPFAPNSQNGGRRRRRRRGGRGRSGRGRPPGPAPMMAPNHNTADAPENSDAPRESQENSPAPASDAQPTPAAPQESHANEPSAPSAPAQPAAHETPAPVTDGTAPETAASSTPVEGNSDGGASQQPADARTAESAPHEIGDEESETEIDTDNVPPAPETSGSSGESNHGSDWHEHPVGDEVPSTEIVIAEQTPAANAREAAPIPAPGQPAPAFTPSRQGGGRSGRDRGDRRYTIQEMLREGQEVLIQVAKEGIGQKGPALTTYLSMPGRYLVLMPAVQRLGVSKRIENEEQRRALKDALNQLNPPDDMGVIVRTAGTGRSKDELQRDMDYLVRVWETLKKKAKVARAPSLIFQEGDVVTRVFRDVITDDVAEIIIDDPVVAERAREFLRENAPGTESKVRLHSDAEPLFQKQGVETQLQRLFNRKVNLRSGGSIVIEQTEALIAIDVNTGRFREKRSQDDTILATNLEAAREIARQLRLRDIGGLVMIDFIDMEIHEHRRRVERELKAHLQRDKARINVLPISSLGVVEMTRQRIRHSLRKTLFDRCPHCSGSGHVKSPESLGLELLREVKGQLRDATIKRVLVKVNPAVAFDILNQFRKDLARLEETRGIAIEVRGDGTVPLSQIQVSTAKEGGEWVLKKISEVDDYVRNS